MMQTPMSVYEVECVCGAKLRLAGKVGTCEKCGRSIEIESWQIQYTKTADGLLVKS